MRIVFFFFYYLRTETKTSTVGKYFDSTLLIIISCSNLSWTFCYYILPLLKHTKEGRNHLFYCSQKAVTMLKSDVNSARWTHARSAQASHMSGGTTRTATGGSGNWSGGFGQSLLITGKIRTTAEPINIDLELSLLMRWRCGAGNFGASFQAVESSRLLHLQNTTDQSGRVWILWVVQ